MRCCKLNEGSHRSPALQSSLTLSKTSFLSTPWIAPTAFGHNKPQKRWHTGTNQCTAKHHWVSDANIRQLRRVLCPSSCTHPHLLSTMHRSSSVECNHTSGSMCLGNSEVVRYLYKILMSSCSNPLLKHQENTGLQFGTGLLTFLLYGKACFCLYSIWGCWVRDVVKIGQWLPPMHEALGSIPSTA